MLDPKKVETVLAALEAGKSLRAAAREINMHASSVLRWTERDNDFAQQYARAREVAYKMLADEIVEISDDASRDAIVDEDGNVKQNTEFVNRARLRVDTRKWILAKMLPKLYGDKVTHEVSGTIRHAHELSDDTLADIATRGSAGTVEAPAEPQKPSAIH